MDSFSRGSAAIAILRGHTYCYSELLRTLTTGVLAEVKDDFKITTWGEPIVMMCFPGCHVCDCCPE